MKTICAQTLFAKFLSRVTPVVYFLQSVFMLFVKKLHLFGKTSGILMYAVILIATMAFFGSEKLAAGSRSKLVVGYSEKAIILPSGLEIDAAMDTGADMPSIHATAISRYRKKHENWVQFTVKSKGHSVVFHRQLIRTVTISRAGKKDSVRLVVELGICIAGFFEITEVNLADRTGLQYPLLVGLTYLVSGGMIVDPAKKKCWKSDL